MINIRNAQGENALLHVKLRKPPGYLSAMLVLHDKDNIRPENLFFSNRLLIKETSGFGFKNILEKLFCCFAPVLILIANKQNPHINSYNHEDNINFAKQRITR